MRNSSLCALIIACLLQAADGNAQPAKTLPNLSADLTQTTVSGLSSGAYMAGQFHVVHSNYVMGAALIAGGPFGCAESWQARTFRLWPGIHAYNALQAVNGCMKNDYVGLGVPSPKKLVKRAKSLADNGEIDQLANLHNDRVYLFAGGKDKLVHSNIVAAAAKFYELSGVSPSNIKFEKNKRAGHTFLTESNGNKCELSAKPFIADCDYDQAGAILKSLYGSLVPARRRLDGEFVRFDQNEFVPRWKLHGMSKTGYVFIPNSCRTARNCRVHIAFHGCQQSTEEIGDAFVKQTGYARWAAANRLIVLFPQIQKSALSNPKGCWDWWGYTGAEFTSKSAPQIDAVWKMLQRLGSDG